MQQTTTNYNYINSSIILKKIILPSHFTIIDTPSILGLRPTGVELFPDALKAAGLIERLNADYAGRVSPLPYNSARDKITHLPTYFNYY